MYDQKLAVVDNIWWQLYIISITKLAQLVSCFKLPPFIILEGRKEMFYLTLHSTHFIYGYMVSDIW